MTLELGPQKKKKKKKKKKLRWTPRISGKGYGAIAQIVRNNDAAASMVGQDLLGDNKAG